MDLSEKLEEVKQLGNYAVNLFYGEDIGYDDLSVAMLDRRVKLVCTPVGCIGEARILWVGILKDLLVFDFKNTIPLRLSNPPKREEYSNSGYYIWGTDSGVDAILARVVVLYQGEEKK